VTALDIWGGLTSQLHARFPDMAVYSEKTTQGTDEPGIYTLISASIRKDVGQRYWIHALYTLRVWLAESEERPRRSLADIGMQLFEELQTVSVSLDGTWRTRPKDLQWEIAESEDLVTTWSADFSASLTHDDLDDLMSSSTINIYKKEEV